MGVYIHFYICNKDLYIILFPSRNEKGQTIEKVTCGENNRTIEKKFLTCTQSCMTISLLPISITIGLL